MKAMKIAVSRALVSTGSTHREKVTLDNTDFTDVAAVVITRAESRSGILALLIRTGFHLPVYLFSQEPTDVPDSATAVISGKAEEFLELEYAASRYEENLFPPFVDTLSQYV
ncbi:ornithine decarboxylase, partial [Enterobacter cloacae]|uniref:Orn/Lys/Arg decarboxylase N-terminal domain-containing protein n=1 Tax=Enterobacter cloacae TaxID=550 RepID=UPI0010262954